MYHETLKNMMTDTTLDFVHPADQLEMAGDVADAGIQFLLGDKSLNDAGLQVMNAGCRMVDRTLDRTLDNAENAIGAVLDTISFFKFW